MILDYTIQIALKSITLKESFDIWCSLFCEINNVEMILSFFKLGHECLSQEVNNIDRITYIGIGNFTLAVAC